MAVSIEHDPATGGNVVRFTLPGDVHEGPVSVVGSFNDWTPGAHPMLPEDDATLSATAVVDGAEVHFRYLGSDGVWFDDPDADEVTADGSVVRAPAHDPAPGAADPAPAEAAPADAPGPAKAAARAGRARRKAQDPATS
jgi:hypothetical protein